MTCPASENSQTVIAALNQQVTALNCLETSVDNVDSNFVTVTASVSSIESILGGIKSAIEALCTCLHLNVTVQGGGGGVGAGGSTEPTAPAPDLGENPPDGFSTWEEYNAYKCSAADFLITSSAALFSFIGGLEATISGAGVGVAVGELIVGAFNFALASFAASSGYSAAAASVILGGAAISTSPIWVQAAIVAAVAAIALLASAGVLSLFATVVSDFLSGKDDLLCLLYNATTIDEARSALSGAWADSIASFVISSPYNAYEAQIRVTLTTIIGYFISTAFVNQLFEKSIAVEKFTSAESCSGCVETSGITAQLELDFTPPVRQTSITLVSGNLIGGPISLLDGMGFWGGSPASPFRFIEVTFDAPVNVTLTGTQTTDKYNIADSEGNWNGLTDGNIPRVMNNVTAFHTITWGETPLDNWTISWQAA